jgi:putative acetyltransferase
MNEADADIADIDRASAGIRVRAMKSADWRDLYEIWTDPRVCWNTLQVPFQSEDEVKKRIETPSEGVYRLVAEVDGRVVGVSALHLSRRPRMRHVAGCGISVHPDYWNQGVGSALMAAVLELADNWLNLKRVELEVYTDNQAAIHLYEKFGFQIEGTKREYAVRGGVYVDTHVMARVRGRDG